MMRVLACLALLFLCASCGYHVAGKADTVPKSVRTIYVPAWGNSTVKYRLTDILPQQVSREFIARSRFRVVNRAEDADASEAPAPETNRSGQWSARFARSAFPVRATEWP